MSERKSFPCFIVYLRDGRAARPMAKALDRLSMPFIAFGRHQAVIVPCLSGAFLDPFIDGLSPRLRANVTQWSRRPDCKAIVCSYVKGSSPYESWGMLLWRARTQGALVSYGLLDMLADDGKEA